jgi:hypothetical protein
MIVEVRFSQSGKIGKGKKERKNWHIIRFCML